MVEGSLGEMDNYAYDLNHPMGEVQRMYMPFIYKFRVISYVSFSLNNVFYMVRMLHVLHNIFYFRFIKTFLYFSFYNTTLVFFIKKKKSLY